MKFLLILVVSFIFSTAFSAQTTSDNSEVNLSELEQTYLFKEKHNNSLTIHVYIDNMEYHEFSVLLTRLYRNGIFNIAVHYGGKALDISSKGMEQALPV